MGDYIIPENKASQIYINWIIDLPLSKKGKNDAIFTI